MDLEGQAPEGAAPDPIEVELAEEATKASGRKSDQQGKKGKKS